MNTKLLHRYYEVRTPYPRQNWSPLFYLDIYNMIQEDIIKTKDAVSSSTQDQLELSVKNNSAYKDAMIKLANNEIDIDMLMGRLILNMETRLSQIFDQMQENPSSIHRVYLLTTFPAQHMDCFYSFSHCLSLQT